MSARPDAALYLPSRSLRIMLAGMYRRWRCGRRFGHFRCEDEGRPSCFRCRAPLM